MDVCGISDALRNELRILHDGSCTDSDIEDFIRIKRLSRKQAGAIWLQISVWNAPECCKACKFVQHLGGYPCNCCSRPKADFFELRDAAQSLGHCPD